jgi:TonB-dependent SusC/RagA subfamily outer membrane receptor
MKIKLFFLIVLSFLSINSISAQNKKITITGTVLDASKKPIVNAIIMIDDKKTNSVTDDKGNYRIKVRPPVSKIGVFTFGYGTAEVEINGRTRIDFNFENSSYQQPVDQAITPGEQGVNTGYGVVKKKNLTTDVNKVDGTNKKYATYANIGDMIQREVSGCRIAGASVVIQDSGDLFGSVPALIIVDGVYMDALPNISPITVKSIEVLKGTAAAIYGSRGYGGAIIIKTKSGND